MDITAKLKNFLNEKKKQIEIRYAPAFIRLFSLLESI